jgi:hypothetical protein
MTEWISKFLAPLFNALLNARITAAFAATAAIVLYLNSRHLLPIALEPGPLLGVLVVGILCGCLACINIMAWVWKVTESARGGLVRLIQRHREKKRIEREIPFLTPNERVIIAYLLAKKQKMFEVLPDGEEAITLISKGFVVHPARRPMALHRDIAVEVPDHVWEVLTKYQDEFRYEPPKDGKVEVQPWRTYWMAR